MHTYGVAEKRLSLWLTAAFLLAGCGAPGSDRPGTVEVMISPAGEGSGEPFLSTSGDAVLMSWLDRSAGGGHDLRVSRLTEAGWSDPLVVARSERFFVNWADFPSITESADGTLWAHWLERGPAGGYDYGIRIVSSRDGGATWSEPWTPHEDGTPTEHGFVSTFALGGGVGFAWLDGRNTADVAGQGPATRDMTLRHRAVGPGDARGPERVLDERVCDCCQTDAAVTAAGPVVVYRDRSVDEIRDIYIARYLDGTWTEGALVHDDGWHTAACPVNGPAVAARGEQVVVAWFTAAGRVPRVKVAFSRDGGATFGPARPVDDGNPGGRVDVLLNPDGAALVSWLERTGGQDAAVLLRRVLSDGSASESLTVASSSSVRGSGFPRMARAADGRIIFAWTDAAAGLVRVAAVTLEGD